MRDSIIFNLLLKKNQNQERKLTLELQVYSISKKITTSLFFF
jgi:hypothetical protein